SYDDDFCADVTNLASNVAVDPVTTKRVNTIHLQSQIIGALQSPVQTRSTNLVVWQKALEDPDWVAAIQEEMQQFYHQQVWKLVPLPDRKIAIGTKWILKNKRDARGIVVLNKAGLVAQGHRQEEGIDYDEVFAPHHYRRGTIDKTLFLKKDSRHIILVRVYVDDIIFGSTNKAWCDEFEVLMKGEFKMSAMGELTFFLGLQVKQLPDGIFISQDKYVKDMLKKFNMKSMRTATTPYEVPKHKSNDEPDDVVNQRDYMRDFVKNNSASVYNQGWTMKKVKAFSIVQLRIEFEYIQQHLKRSNLLNFRRFTFRAKPTLDAPSAKRANQGAPLVLAASSKVPSGVPAAPSFPANVLVHAATSSAPADISVLAVSSAHAAASVLAETVVHTAESHLDDPLTASKHVSTEPTIVAPTPSSSRTRRKHIAKKRVTPIVDMADVAMIKFNSDSDSDDDPLPYAPYDG
nr:copia protein [Tanacetum cinerariifolium]